VYRTGLGPAPLERIGVLADDPRLFDRFLDLTAEPGGPSAFPFGSRQ
jgi:hypothetical protein